MKIKIIQVGKNKSGWIEDGVSEFLKRICAFAEVEVVIVRETRASDTFMKERCIEEEGEEILKQLREGDVLVGLDERGRQYESKEFSKFLKKYKDWGQRIAFVIGGPYGLSSKVKEQADELLSFSKMTFTHQMIRLFLLEQIYRGLSIMSGKEYHNE